MIIIVITEKNKNIAMIKTTLVSWLTICTITTENF